MQVGAEELATQDQATTTRLPGPSQLRLEAAERAIAFTYQNCCSESIHSSSEQAQQNAEAGCPESAETLGSLAMEETALGLPVHLTSVAALVSTLISLQAKRHAARSPGRSPCSSQDLWGRSATKIVLGLTSSSLTASTTARPGRRRSNGTWSIRLQYSKNC